MRMAEVPAHEPQVARTVRLTWISEFSRPLAFRGCGGNGSEYLSLPDIEDVSFLPLTNPVSTTGRALLATAT